MANQAARVLGKAILELVATKGMATIEKAAQEIGEELSDDQKLLARAAVIAGAMAMVEIMDELEHG